MRVEEEVAKDEQIRRLTADVAVARRAAAQREREISEEREREQQGTKSLRRVDAVLRYARVCVTLFWIGSLGFIWARHNAFVAAPAPAETHSPAIVKRFLEGAVATTRGNAVATVTMAHPTEEAITVYSFVATMIDSDGLGASWKPVCTVRSDGMVATRIGSMGSVWTHNETGAPLPWCEVSGADVLLRVSRGNPKTAWTKWVISDVEVIMSGAPSPKRADPRAGAHAFHCNDARGCELDIEPGPTGAPSGVGGKIIFVPGVSDGSVP